MGLLHATRVSTVHLTYARHRHGFWIEAGQHEMSVLTFTLQTLCAAKLRYKAAIQ